jgi:hypothetical protein
MVIIILKSTPCFFFDLQKLLTNYYQDVSHLDFELFIM